MIRNGMELNSQLGSLLSLHLSRARGDQRENGNLGELSNIYLQKIASRRVSLIHFVCDWAYFEWPI